MAQRLRSRRCALAAALAAAAVFASDGARAARVVDVRMGRHPEFVRVVFETDAPVQFTLEGEPGAGGELRVRLDAEAAPRRVSLPGEGAPAVEIEPRPEGGAVARIRVDGPVRVESQVLGEPPRVVLDLRAAPELAIPSEPPAQPAPPPEPVAEEAPPPEPGPFEPEGEVAEEVRPPLALEPLPPAPEPEPEPEPVEEQPAAPPEPPLHVEPPPPEPLPPPEPPASLRDWGVLVDWGVEPVSAALGAVLGLLLGLLLATAGRRREPAKPGPEVAVEVAEEASAPVDAKILHPEVAVAAAIELDDLLRMFQSLDGRLASIELLCAALQEQAARAEARSLAHSQELRAQRAAIARVQRRQVPVPISSRTDTLASAGLRSR